MNCWFGLISFLSSIGSFIIYFQREPFYAAWCVYGGFGDKSSTPQIRSLKLLNSHSNDLPWQQADQQLYREAHRTTMVSSLPIMECHRYDEPSKSLSKRRRRLYTHPLSQTQVRLDIVTYVLKITYIHYIA